MHEKKLFLLLCLLALIMTTSGIVWFWWADSPPKTPLRSRSVQQEYVMPTVAQLPLTCSMETG